jgi:tetraacyldisaccharide-1-P 4'-kinase
MAFRDHHPFDARDLKKIESAAKACFASIILTTEKDAVRLAACNPDDLPLASVPLFVGVEPADRFRDWLFARLVRDRGEREVFLARRSAEGAEAAGRAASS